MDLEKVFSFEKVASRSINYYENMVDEKMLPYFNIFWSDIPEAAHDWPDNLDVVSRQLQAAVMMRKMTGHKLKTEDSWLAGLLQMLGDDDVFHFLKVDYINRVLTYGDSALPLYAIANIAIEDDNLELKKICCRVCDGMLKMYKNGNINDTAPVWRPFAIKSLMLCVRHFESKSALELAKLLTEAAFSEVGVFAPDNVFRAHVHGGLRALGGIADYALYVKDPILFSRVYAIFKDLQDKHVTSFGFLPEDLSRQCDIVGCETCALMDYAVVGVTLANAGHAELWDSMERLSRNHLLESQAIDCAWLGESPTNPVENHQFSHRDIAKRVSGVWAGWSSPTHILAGCETLNKHWGGPELKNKIRAFQNCCGGSGVHALYLLWKNIASFKDGILKVNMHIDKELVQAEIRCLQPYEGKLIVTLKSDCPKVLIRGPKFTNNRNLSISINQKVVECVLFGNYVLLNDCKNRDVIEFSYPLEIQNEIVSIGNDGFRKWTYNVTWKGDTVIKLMPHNIGETLVYSDYEQSAVKTFYGEAGPGRLYQRDGMFSNKAPEEKNELQPDDGINLWDF